MRCTQPLFLLFLLLVPAGIFYIRKFTSPGPKHRAVGILRGTSIVLLVLALAGIEVRTSDSGVNVLYLIDGSESLTLTQREAAVEAAADMSREGGDIDGSAWAVFGRDVQLEESFGRSVEFGVPASMIDRSVTDIEEALVSSLSLFPEEGERRIVLFTDGLETSGDMLSAAARLQGAGVSVFPVPLRGREGEQEVYIEHLSVPGVVREDEPHEVSLHIYSTADTSARVLFNLDGVYSGEDTIGLSPGLNVWTYTAICSGKGLHLYQAEIFPLVDGRGENNTASAVVRTEGRPSVLLVSPEEGGPSVLAGVLSVQGIEVRRVPPVGIPPSPVALSGYDVVILDNVPAYDMSYETMERIERYVRMGGGLLMTGGEDSFGVGGFFSTPIEKILPVSMDVTSRLDIPPLSVVMLIDKSGSMGAETAAGVPKLDLVKEAVMAAVDVLNPFYTVGVLSFDADYEWTVFPMEAGRKDEINRGVGTLESGGGTRLFQALEEAFRVQGQSEAPVRHSIILSDGQTDTRDFKDLIDMMAREGITVSTVGVGEDADRNLLENIARWGRGRAYYTDDPADIPSIFVTESMIVSRNLIVEEPFIPGIEAKSDIMKGIDPFGLPALEGFVLTYLKEPADLVLSAAGGSPLLAVRRYGLGRSAAFTSDMKGRWSAQFLAWAEFPRFAGQLIRALSGPAGDVTLETDLAYEDSTLQVTLDIINDNEEYVNFLDIAGYVIDPDGKETEVSLAQTAPGSYYAEIEAREAGLYTLTCFDVKGGGTFPVTSFGLTVPYPEEYLPREADISRLDSLAGMTGGRLVDPYARDGSGVYERSEDAGGRYASLRILLGLLALAVFLGELIVRYAPGRTDTSS